MILLKILKNFFKKIKEKVVTNGIGKNSLILKIVNNNICSSIDFRQINKI